MQSREDIMAKDINEIKMQIQSIDWSLYETAYGNAGENIPLYTDETNVIPKIEAQLLQLFSGNHEMAMHATHDLWCSLCHDYAFISSAALPACEFLLYGLETLDDELKIELLDIFRGFVSVISADWPKHTWQGKLRRMVEAEKSYFLELAESENEEVAGFANDILEELWQGGMSDLDEHMKTVVEQARNEQYTKYLENIEIARREMEAVKLYPKEEVVCDFYAIPSQNEQAYYAVVYHDNTGFKMVYAKTQIYTPENPPELGEPIRMYDFRTCRDAMERSVHNSKWQGHVVIGLKKLSDDFVKQIDNLRKNLPEKYILEGDWIVICDGEFQAIRFFEQGQVVKEVVYEIAEQIPVESKELVNELENMYLTVGEIIA